MTMKSSTLSVDIRSVSFWYKLGIFGLAILSIYVITEKFTPAFKYPFLSDLSTIRYFKKSKTIVIVQDDMNLRNKIKEVYGSIAVFCSAKHTSDLVSEVETFCTEGKNVIVVNENILSKESIDPIPGLAERFKYTVHITKPRRKLVPLYAGWLLNDDDSVKLLREGKLILEDLLKTVPQFSSSFKNFSGQDLIQDMVKYYQLASSNANGMLHCTAKYLGNSTVPGSIQYWNKPEVNANIGRSYGLNVIGLVWTPRTFGARVKLNSEELLLWGNDEDSIVYPNVVDEVQEKKPDFAPVKGKGSRAHITVGVANGVQAVVTGKDLLEIVQLEALQLHDFWPTYECKLGWLRDYGAGKWVLYSNENRTVGSMFDGVYNSSNRLFA